MAQKVHVVSCVGCKFFQVQIVKKSNKWVCKICNTKQSVLKVYGEGTGSYCRELVQKLNAAKGQKDEEALEELDWSDDDFFDESGETDNSCCLSNDSAQPFGAGVIVVPKSKSKWAKYDESKLDN